LLLDTTRARCPWSVGKQKNVKSTRNGRGHPRRVWFKGKSAGGCRFDGSICHLIGAPYTHWVSDTVRQRTRNHDPLRPRSGARIASVLRFRFRASKMNKPDGMRGCARLGRHFSLTGSCSTDTKRVAVLPHLPSAGAVARRMVARSGLPLVRCDVADRWPRQDENLPKILKII